jgi:hypothetical protein
MPSRILSSCLSAMFALSLPTAAKAATAVFSSSTAYPTGTAGALSTAGDSAGALVSLNNWIGLLFAAPFGASRSDTVSIFSVAPTVGNARLTISVGRYNGGTPTYVDTRSVNAGNALTFTNLFQQGCAALGGCDFLYITTTRQRAGAPGATVDYLSVNGGVVTVTEPAPEPSTWALLILGFIALAWRLTARRRGYSPSSANGSPAMCSR